MARPDPKGVDAILDNFDKNEGADYDDDKEILDDEDEGVDDDDDSTGDESEDTGETGEEGEGDEQQTSEGAGAGTEDGGQSQFRALPNGLFTDQKGNIVDPRTGQVIARAGSERRLYEKGVRLQDVVESRGQRIVDLEKQLADVRFLDEMPRKLSLTNDDVFEGLKLVAKFKQDPLAAAKEVIALAAAQGHNVSDIIGTDVGDAVELRAIKQMLDERLAPLVGQHQATQRQTEQLTAAQKKLQTFFQEHEYSDIHVDILNDTVGKTNMSPEKAYYELKLWCANNGFDFTQPLRPQVLAAQQQQRGGNRQQSRQQRPMVNGRGRGNNARNMSEPDYADPKSSWDDILKTLDL